MTRDASEPFEPRTLERDEQAMIHSGPVTSRAVESQGPWIVGLVVGAVVLIFYRQVAALYEFLFAWVPFSKSLKTRERYWRVTVLLVGAFFLIGSTIALLTGADPAR
jgi:hypothetical protein